MGLHNALQPSTMWVWRFYEAVVERRGRAHLLRVPLVKREVIIPPNWYYSERDRQEYIDREQRYEELYYFPALIYEGAPIERLCHRTQRANSWSLMEWYGKWAQWEGDTQRGMCTTCLTFARSTPNPAILNGPENIRQATAMRPITRNTNMKEWTRFEQGFRD